MRLPSLLLIALLTACSATPVRNDAPPASEVRSTDDLGAIAAALAESPKRTLLVLDIDDTLLTSVGFFGSDSWYEWQQGLKADDPGKVPCLFDVISLNYETGGQRATQPDGPALVNAVQVDKLLLTSRNPLYRGGTLRTLRDAGYALPAPLAGQADGSSWDFRKAPDAAPVRITYDQGVFMTTGQDKGLALLALLQRLHTRYDRVVLVDDGKKNIDNMQNALRKAGVDYLGLHYLRVDKSIAAADAQAGRAGWQAWQRLLGEVYPQRLQALQQGQCDY